MVDFKKLLKEPKEPELEYLYKCGRCNEEFWFSPNLPEHLRKGHRKGGVGQKCWGTLIFVRTRPAK